MKKHMVRKIVLSVVGLVVMLLFAACSGVGTTSAPSSLSGTITAVNAANHSVTISSGGQSYTITGLSDQAVQVLQTQIGKTYTLQVSQNSDGSFSLTAGTQPTPGESTPEPGETPSANAAAGNISFTGPIQSVSNSSLTVKLPDGSTLTMALNASTDRSDLNGAQLSTGQVVKVEANTNPDGSFTASKVKLSEATSDDANTVDFQGSSSQTVGTDNVLHFKVGNQSYSYTISATAKLDDFNGNAHTIASGTPIKVEVQFTGTTGSITKISNSSN
jgi:uncharacterized protein DUF5666